MSRLLIRTEAPPPEQFVDDWRPRSAEAPRDDGDDTPFAPLLLALEAELAALFGLETAVHPGRGLPPGAPDVAHDLGALLATIRLGGDPARPVTQLTGVTTARHGRQIGERLQPVAHRLWPATSRRPALVVDVIVTTGGGTIVGSIRLPAPVEPAPLVPPRPLGAAAFALPMRLPVRLAEEVVPLARLLPLAPGLVIPFNTMPDLPLLLGDHRVARVGLTPLPDGRQQASITMLDLDPQGDQR